MGFLSGLKPPGLGSKPKLPGMGGGSKPKPMAKPGLMKPAAVGTKVGMKRGGGGAVKPPGRARTQTR